MIVAVGCDVYGDVNGENRAFRRSNEEENSEDMRSEKTDGKLMEIRMMLYWLLLASAVLFSIARYLFIYNT